MLKQLIIAALLLPAAAQANQIWQVIFDYPDRVQFLTPTPDETYYISLGPLIANWESLGYIIGASDRQCSNACVANVIYKSSGFDPANPAPAVSPEPETFAMVGIGLLAGIGCFWSSRRIA